MNISIIHIQGIEAVSLLLARLFASISDGDLDGGKHREIGIPYLGDPLLAHPIWGPLLLGLAKKGPEQTGPKFLKIPQMVDMYSMYVYIYITYVCMYVCMYVCIYIYTFTLIYIYIHIYICFELHTVTLRCII